MALQRQPQMEQMALMQFQSLKRNTKLLFSPNILTPNGVSPNSRSISVLAYWVLNALVIVFENVCAFVGATGKLFVHDGIKIPSTTIVLQAWVSSVVCRLSSILNMGFFPKALS